MSNGTDLSISHVLKTVAVVVPMHNRIELTPEEEISLRHLVHFLGSYDKYLVIPKSLEVNYPGFGIKRFDNNFFGSAKAYRKLMFSPKFYETFIDYKYILIYQLDCLVFSDQLTQWCKTDLDYIGAPWIKHKDAPYVSNLAFEGKVGNGGFSLRKIQSFLKVIYSQRYHIEPVEYWKRYYASKPRYIQYMNLSKKFLKHLSIFNNARWELASYEGNDDKFFANRATYYYPEFKIAPVETALRFAFECVPQYCFKRNNYTLPFGCHAWHRYDRGFWEPYLLK
jgi:hypothetical protein